MLSRRWMLPAARALIFVALVACDDATSPATQSKSRRAPLPLANVSGVSLTTGSVFTALPIGSARAAVITSINNSGMAAGRIYSADLQTTEAAVWTNSQLVELGWLPPNTSSQANAVNDQGVVVGTSPCFRWTSGTGMTALGWADTPPSGFAPSQCSNAVDVNNNGEVLGGGAIYQGINASGYYWKSRLGIWSPVSGWRLLPAPGTDYDCVPVSMNDNGWAVGWCGFAGQSSTYAWKPDGNGSYTVIQLVTNTQGVRDINNNNVILGVSPGSTPDVWLWSEATGRQSIPGLYDGSAINDAGEVAGQTATQNGSFLPVVWSQQTGIVTLSVTGLNCGVCSAVNINNNGQAVGGQWQNAVGIWSATNTPQTITFTSTPPSPATVGATYALSATGGGSGNPVTFSSLTTSTCTVSGSSATLLSSGTCTIAANQAGSGTYAAAAQVTQSFTISDEVCAASPSGIVSWWHAEGDGADAIGSNTGTLQNGAAFASGKVGQAFSFDGVDDWVMVGNPSTLKLTNGITIEGWVNPAYTSGTYGVIASKWAQNTGTDSYWFAVVMSTPMRLVSALNVAASGGRNYVSAEGGAIPSGQWSHVAMTFDPATGLDAIYVNGQIVASGTLPGSIITSDANVVIGGEGTSPTFRPFAGAIDEVTIYNRALSPQEIAAIASAGAAGKCPPISQQPQVITFTSVAPSPIRVGASYGLTATGGGSGNPVTFSSLTPTTCTVFASTATMIGVGTCTVAADQAGNGSYTPAAQVTQSFAVSPALVILPSVEAGQYHTCALMPDGAVQCWGLNDDNRVTPPADLGPVAQLSVGWTHNCALRTTGDVRCWGRDSYGDAIPPAELSATQISAGGIMTCAINALSTIACWGSPTDGETSPPSGLVGVPRVSAGGDAYGCAIKSDGTVVCWGFSSDGRTTVPAGLGSVTQVSTGFVHTCVRTATQTVVCWGPNADGGATVPADLSGVAQVSAGGGHTCALKSTGTVTCWGRNTSGQATVPIGLSSVMYVDAGENHTCARRTDGTIVCWGSNSNGQTNVPAALKPALMAQFISFTSTAPSAAAYGGSYAVSATGGGSGNPVTFSSLTSSVCSVASSTVSFVGVGTCTIAANQAGSLLFADAVQATQTFTVSRASQTVSFTSAAPSPALLGSGYTMNATASTGFAVTFSSLTTGVCTVAGNVATFVGVGTCTVAASQAGTSNYLPAQATQGFNVIYVFAGFIGSVANAPTVNTEKAGSIVKIKFTLNGNQGLGVIASAVVGAISGNCSTTAVPTVSAPATASTAFKYDPTTNQYLYSWQTQKAWIGTCQQFVLTLIDGTIHQANFQFTK